MLFLNIHILLSSEITIIYNTHTQTCLGLSYTKIMVNITDIYIIHLEIQYMPYKHTTIETHFLYPQYYKRDISFRLL